MLRRGVKHELLLLRVLGKVRKCGDTSAVAAAASRSRFEACASLVRDRQIHTAGCQVIPSEGPNPWEIAHTGLFGSSVGRRHPIAIAAAGTGELGNHAAFSARCMSTTGTDETSSSGSSTSEAGITAGSGAPDTLHAGPAPSSEDAPSTTGGAQAAATSDTTTTDSSSAAQAALSADDLLLSDPAAAGGLTTAEQERQAALAPVLLQAAQEFEAARGHPAKVYVHIKSVDKIRLPGGGLANVRSAGLPVKRTLVTVNRSPHVDKKARDQFEMKVHRHLLVIETQTHRLHHKLAELRNHDLPGVQMKVTFQYQTRLDRSLLA